MIAGYGLSSAIRPLTALIVSWPQLLAVRFMDRVGKGVRTAPRDAMLAACATPTTRGRVFGFHRAMDHVGAVLGPLLASLFLLAWPGRYRLLFALTIIPGALAVASLFFVKEPRAEGVMASAPRAPGVDGAIASWRDLPARFYVLLGVLLVFTLGNSADAFLLLRLTDVGVNPALIPLLWSLLHVVKATMSVWGGIKSDRWGRRLLIGAGWVIYAVVYAGFAVTTSISALVAWFLIYGVYYGLSEGTEEGADRRLRAGRAAGHGVRDLQRRARAGLALRQCRVRPRVEEREPGGGVRPRRRAGDLCDGPARGVREGAVARALASSAAIIEVPHDA